MHLTNQDIIDGVLKEFLALCEIPHASRQEHAISDYLKNRLRELNADVVQDEIYNIWAHVPATCGLENAPMVALQAHMDMVCAVGDSDYAPQTDAIQTRIEEGWLCSGGRSSIGADCGAGVALILWMLAQRQIQHPPLRIIFTVQEEIGLQGAKKIPPQSVEGVKTFINLDGFDLQRILIGSAGGVRERYVRAIDWVPKPEGRSYLVELSGLSGGHSGFDMVKRRTNAIVLMGELLRQLQTKSTFEIASFSGGEACNAIAYRCRAVIISDVAIEEQLRSIARETLKDIQTREPGAMLSVIPCAAPEKVWAQNLTKDVLTLLQKFSNGVYRMHPALPETVSESSNLGFMKQENDKIILNAMIRFTDHEMGQVMQDEHRTVAALHGFSEAGSGCYPAWQPKENSVLVRKISALYEKYIGQRGKVMVQHVGLEPALFLEKNADMECVSLGMDIEGCHSPQERWRLDSIPPLAHILATYLEMGET